MLSELNIENLAVIDAAELVFHPGLNVITGETGAGKTILAHAISLLLGIRADSSMIRPGASEASVEAVFSVPPGCYSDLADSIDVPDGEMLAVRRRISRDGRSRAFIGGRTATLGVLAELTGRLLAFSAQHEQRRLMLASRQLDLLDVFAGPELAALADEYGILFDQREEVIARLQGLNLDVEGREREAELLRFQLEEIQSAALAPGEDSALETERMRLVKAQELREATRNLSVCLLGNEGGDGIINLLGEVMARLENAAGVDAELDDITARLQKSYYELEECARSSREYSEGVLEDPARLEAVEERLDLIKQLHRKYGDAGSIKTGSSMDCILGYAQAAAVKLKSLSTNIAEVPELEQRKETLTGEMLELAGNMRRLRRQAAGNLEIETSGHLRDLAFNECGFEVRLTPSGTETVYADSLARNGADSGEFLVRLNPGMPASPLRETASGGELSRIMLAIKSAVSGSRETATLVFDEIDAGIGGETGSAVGDKLSSLASSCQIICITHLPQIARNADAHFRVVKHAEAGKTMTTVEALAGDSLIDELCRMMGAKPKDAKARAHAASLLKRQT